MKTRIALIPLVALAVVTLGAGVGAPVASPAATAGAATSILATPDADHQPPLRRVALPVLPTVTVMPSRDERLAALGQADDDSLMLGAAVDRAAEAIARPVGAALPRAQLGNPFYDFARLRRNATE